MVWGMAAVLAGPAALAAQASSGRPGTPNIHVLAHLPLGRPFTVSVLSRVSLRPLAL